MFLICTWWRHQVETISALLAICAGNSPFPKGQWRGALMFTLISARINGWVNNREAGDLRRYRTHSDVIAMNWRHMAQFSHHEWKCSRDPFVTSIMFNTLSLRRNGRHFIDDTFKRVFMNENIRISINFSLKFVPKCLINNIPALVQIIAWRRPGDKPLSDPRMENLPTHICVTRPQWVKNRVWPGKERKSYFN